MQTEFLLQLQTILLVNVAVDMEEYLTLWEINLLKHDVLNDCLYNEIMSYTKMHQLQQQFNWNSRWIITLFSRQIRAGHLPPNRHELDGDI